MGTGASWKITCPSLDTAALPHTAISHMAPSFTGSRPTRSAVHEAYRGGKIYEYLTGTESRSLKGHTEYLMMDSCFEIMNVLF